MTPAARYHAGRMGGLSRTHLLILLVAGAVGLLAFLGRRTLTEHEVFAAEPAREMLAGQGWILQPFAGEYRTKKPPGQSWLIAASLFVTQSHSEWAARWPSASAGIGLAVVTAMIAARLGTSRQGLIAGLMTLTCVGVQQRARLAEADMALAFFVALANAVPVLTLSGPSRGRRPVAPANDPTHRLPAIVFWAAIVSGFMVKGPIVLGFTLLPAAVAWAILRFAMKDVSAATALRRGAFWWPAVVVGLLLIVAWPTAAYFKYPGVIEQWWHEIVDRTQGNLGHGDERRHDPLVAYGWLLPQSTLPWFPFAIVGGWLAWRTRAFRRHANVFLACWAGCGFVMVSAIAFKVLHYVLPIVPPVLILSAVGFDWLLTRWLRRRPAAWRAVQERVSIAGWFGVATAAWLVWSGAVVPQKDAGRAVVAFARRVDATVPPGETIRLYGVGEERTVWYLRHTARQTTAVPTGPAYVICTRAGLADLSGAMVLHEADAFFLRQDADDRRILVRIDR